MYSAFQLAKKYFHYYRTASNSKGHGVHSPFVFGFIKHIKNDVQQYACYDKIESIRKKLINNKEVIEVQDFGAGSTVIKTNRRVVLQMAKSSLKPKKFAQLLFRMVQFYKPITLVELGTSFGVTSAYLASANQGSNLYTLEGAPSIAGIAKKTFAELAIRNVQLIEGDFAVTLPTLLSKLKTIDFAFIDGNHRKAPTLEYFHELLKHSTSNTILVFDDIHWSVEMEEAWHQIKNHEAVTLTIDLFFIGIVFFKNEFKQKQHFSLRF